MTEPGDVFSAGRERLPAELPRVHGFEHGADGRRQGQRRALGWALALKIALLLTEVAGGLAIAVLLVWSGARILRDTTHVLMEGTPRGMETDRVRAAMLGVADIHHLHLWNLASDIPALSAHVVVTGDPSVRDAQQTADQVRAILTDQFGLTHMTLELESTRIERSAPGSR